MAPILIAGGNSGIGLESARALVARGHDVILLGRDRAKGEQAVASFGVDSFRVKFVAADIATHQGVREAASRLLDEHDQFDAVVHATGVFLTADHRTADGLHPMFAVNYLSRYHLTQLLLPALLRTECPRVIMMTAKIPPTTAVDLDEFPRFEPFNFSKMRKPIQVANHHYAAHLASAHPSIRAGVINAGSAKTEILRLAPWYIRAGATLFAPLMFNSLAESAHNVIEAADTCDWPAPTYWPKPNDFAQRTPIAPDTALTSQLIGKSAELTGS